MIQSSAGIVRRHKCRDNATIFVQNLISVNNLMVIDVTFLFSQPQFELPDVDLFWMLTETTACWETSCRPVREQTLLRPP